MALTEKQKAELQEIYKEAGLTKVKVTKKTASRTFRKYRNEWIKNGN